MSCRCGHNGDGPHPCHFMAYTCRKPATQRFYNARAVALAGVQMKFQANETWACDECWESFTQRKPTESNGMDRSPRSG